MLNNLLRKEEATINVFRKQVSVFCSFTGIQTLEVWITLPISFFWAVHIGESNKVTIIGIVVQDAELLPQSSINFLGTIVNFNIFKESLAKYAHTVNRKWKVNKLLTEANDDLIKYLFCKAAPLKAFFFSHVLEESL